MCGHMFRIHALLEIYNILFELIKEKIMKNLLDCSIFINVLIIVSGNSTYLVYVYKSFSIHNVRELIK